MSLLPTSEFIATGIPTLEPDTAFREDLTWRKYEEKKRNTGKEAVKTH